MKIVKSIPDPIPAIRQRDPWLDGLFDGKLRVLEASDLEGRYGTPRSAVSAIRQAARSRKLTVTVAVRGTDVYVQAKDAPSSNGDKPAKPAAKRPPRKAAAKA